MLRRFPVLLLVACATEAPAPPAVVAAPEAPAAAPAAPPVAAGECDPSGPATCGGGKVCCVPCCEPGAVAQCVAPGASGGCPLPDLTLDPDMLRASVTQDVFMADDKTCPETLACLKGTGVRDIVRFTTASRNAGEAPFIAGKPSEHPDKFVFSQCHDHYHSGELIQYRLLDGKQQVVATGGKPGFCLMDDMDWKASGKMPTFNCGNQGISPGWADLYGSPLDCQWVDVTGVPAGDYTLEVEINADRAIRESDYGNNISRAPVRVGR